jgi:hypothetical protein
MTNTAAESAFNLATRIVIPVRDRKNTITKLDKKSTTSSTSEAYLQSHVVQIFFMFYEAVFVLASIDTSVMYALMRWVIMPS